ncbi:MAG: DNA-binding protein, partial [Methanosarcinales archaeon]|nr:DNA-binding protein [Methanosarcinales archaeon]
MPEYVADSSVFILGMPLPQLPLNRTVTTPDVLQELKDMRSKMAFEAAVDHGLRIEQPLPHLVSEVCDRARTTGDFDRLSETDIGLLAKTLEYDGILCTDDYAIQNVA